LVLSRGNFRKICRRTDCGEAELDLPEMRRRSSLGKTEHGESEAEAGGACMLSYMTVLHEKRKIVVL